MYYPNCYNYYPEETSAKYIKWYENHDDDMTYRHNGGRITFTKQEIVELGEENKIKPYN